MTEKLVIVKHAWENFSGEDNGAGPCQGDKTLHVKAHIQMTPVEKYFNQDRTLEVHGCWTIVIRKQTSNDLYP